jgi:hypothetical protein
MEAAAGRIYIFNPNHLFFEFVVGGDAAASWIRIL